MHKFRHFKNSGTIATNAKILWLGVAIFSLTLSAFVTSTVAWFTVSDKLVASNIAIKFDEREDFQIGLVKSGDTTPTFKQDWDNSSLQEYNPSFNPSSPLYPTSSMFASKWLDGADYKSTIPVLRGFTNGGSGPEGDISTSGFFQFEFYFKSMRDTYVFLSDTTTCKSNEDANNVNATKNKLNVDDLNKVDQCVRVSFYSEMGYTIYEPNASSSSNTLLGGRLNVAGNDKYYDYSNETNQEIMYGEYNNDSATLYYDEAVTTEAEEPAKPTCFNSISKLGVAPLNISRSISEGNLQIATEKTYTLSELSKVDVSAHPLLYIPAGTYQRMVVSIYLEGWDLDVVDSIGSAEFDLNLAFSGLYMSKE